MIFFHIKEEDEILLHFNFGFEIHIPPHLSR